MPQIDARLKILRLRTATSIVAMSHDIALSTLIEVNQSSIPFMSRHVEQEVSANL
jgi:hypothetical protein